MAIVRIVVRVTVVMVTHSKIEKWGFIVKDILFTGLDVSGNCWYGRKCNRCNGNSYINGVEFCCPNCEGTGLSLSSINGKTRCTCNQPGYQDGTLNVGI